MKNYTALGILLGVLVSLAFLLGSFAWFIIPLIFITIGGFVGAHFDKRIDLTEIWSNVIGKGQG